jgi:hypothetical protein
VLNTIYQGRLARPGLPAAAVHAARSGVAGGLAVAHAAGSAALVRDARAAYAGGLDVMLWVCAGIAVAAAALALAFLPRQAHEAADAARPGESGPADTVIPQAAGAE